MDHVCLDSNKHDTRQETFVCPACKRFLAKCEREPLTDNRSSRQLERLDNVLEQSMAIRLQEQIRN